MLLSQQRLRQILGALWLIDGLLQLQPHMFTLNLVYGIMLPTLQDQPAPVAAVLQWLISGTERHLVLVNLLTAAVQLAIGLLLLSGRWVKGALIVSFVWALIVWFAFEGAGLLLTGQASIINGAPGAFLLYIVLGLAVYPQHAPADASERGWLSRVQLRWFLASLWCLVAVLQLQPPWWVPGEISGSIAVMIGSGGLNGALVDPILGMLSSLAAQIEISAELRPNLPLSRPWHRVVYGKGKMVASLPDRVHRGQPGDLVGMRSIGQYLDGTHNGCQLRSPPYHYSPCVLAASRSCTGATSAFEQYSATAGPFWTISIILCGKIEREAAVSAFDEHDEGDE